MSPFPAPCPSPPRSNWLDILLTLFRAGVALITVLAGVVALFTDHALVKRTRPLTGFWNVLRNTPLETRELSPWGLRILEVLFLAGMLQFSGDWLKDKKSEIDNTEKMSNLTCEISHTVGQATETSTTAITEATNTLTVATNSSTEAIKHEAQKQTDAVVGNVKKQLHRVNEGLYPFKNVGWSMEFDLNERNEEAQKILSRIASAMEDRHELDFKLPNPDASEVRLDSGIASEVEKELVDASSLEAEIVGSEEGYDLGTSITAPERFAELKFNVDGFGPILPTYLECGDAYEPTERFQCTFDVYSRAPLAEPEASQSGIFYLEQLAGGSLFLWSPSPYGDLLGPDSFLTLKKICLHVGSQALCFRGDKAKATVFQGVSAYVVQFPPTLDSILGSMIGGPLFRTSSTDLSKVFTIPD